MDQSDKRRIVEALILGSSEPISAARLAEIIPYLKPAKAKELVAELNADYIAQHRSFEICEVAGGYRVRTLAEFAPYLQQTQKTRPLRLSQAALETLAIVAYRQPVTRYEVETIRGVDAGAVVRGLIERKLVRIAGHREVPGRPMLYATTRRFLEVFELNKLEELPTLRDLQELFPEGGLSESDSDDEETSASAPADSAAEASADFGSDSDAASKGVASAPTEPASDVSPAVSFAE
ncbi:MAG: SMC-Scp complex subunit ScpB [Deltaproteobacteria bacterium]|nr:MAG: SMC-Scp complex subunit ScpB [Deltaproteobacteria bacterium]